MIKINLVSTSDSVILPNLNKADVQCEVANVCVHLLPDDDNNHDDDDNHDDDEEDDQEDEQEDDLRHLPHVDHLKVKLDHKHTGKVQYL